MLRIDAGMHNAPIRRIALDRTGQWLVTASEDKTAKVWDLTTGRFARSLRPPVGEDNEGRLAALAMSPNAAMVAVAGWTGMWGKTASIYVFDRSSGRMTRELAGLPGMIEALAWSPDGQYLAVSFAQGGVRVYRTDTWAVAGTDTNYGGRVVGLDFSRTNALLSASHDGFLRLHALGPDGLKLSAKRAGPGGTLPTTARFSPDGALIAVGYADSTQVSVLNGTSLAVAFAANTQSARNGDLRTVAWSSDGRTLFAAGRYVAGNRQVVRSWGDAGRGAPKDDPVAANSIFDLQPMPGGGVLYCTAEPAWGMLGTSGKRRLRASSPIADFRGGGEQLQVSRDGHRIRFGFERNGRLTASFDNEQGVVVSDTTTTMDRVDPPLMKVPGLVVTGWQDTGEPKLNGLPLRLKPGENSRSLAHRPRQAQPGARERPGLNKYDAGGKLLGRIATPGAAWAGNVSGDGRSCSALFPTAPFAGTTPGPAARSSRSSRTAIGSGGWRGLRPGYYAASAGGEELIGWQVNNGPDRAGDFYPASRFRAKFYRPDVLARTLDVENEAEALRLAKPRSGRVSPHVEIAQSLPPVIDAVSPTEAKFAQPAVTVRFRVRSSDDAPLQDIRVRVNGAGVLGGSSPETAGRRRGEKHHREAAGAGLDRGSLRGKPQRRFDAGHVQVFLAGRAAGKPGLPSLTCSRSASRSTGTRRSAWAIRTRTPGTSSRPSSFSRAGCMATSTSSSSPTSRPRARRCSQTSRR